MEKTRIMLDKIFVHSNNRLFIQILRYAIAGGISTLADVSAFHIAANIITINHIAANTLSFVIGVLVNYFLSRNWVFNSKSRNIKRDFLLFLATGIIGLLLSNLILYVLIDLGALYAVMKSSSGEMINMTGKIIAVVLVFIWKFVSRRNLVFGRQK